MLNLIFGFKKLDNEIDNEVFWRYSSASFFGIRSVCGSEKRFFWWRTFHVRPRRRVFSALSVFSAIMVKYKVNRKNLLNEFRKRIRRGPIIKTERLHCLEIRIKKAIVRLVHVWRRPREWEKARKSSKSNISLLTSAEIVNFPELKIVTLDIALIGDCIFLFRPQGNNRTESINECITVFCLDRKRRIYDCHMASGGHRPNSQRQTGFNYRPSSTSTPGSKNNRSYTFHGFFDTPFRRFFGKCILRERERERENDFALNITISYDLPCSIFAKPCITSENSWKLGMFMFMKL